MPAADLDGGGAADAAFRDRPLAGPALAFAGVTAPAAGRAAGPRRLTLSPGAGLPLPRATRPAGSGPGGACPGGGEGMASAVTTGGSVATRSVLTGTSLYLRTHRAGGRAGPADGQVQFVSRT